MGKMIDLTGQRFTKLTVIKRAETNSKRPEWECKCDCGNTVIVEGASLRGGRTKSCGCIKRDGEDVTGQQFNQLTAIKKTGYDNGNNVVWLFKCECGNEKEIRLSKVKRGEVKSCGCHMGNIKHNDCKDGHIDKLYYTWAGMKQRCNNPNNTRYKNYGARGISYDARWEEYANFKEDMEASFLEHVSIHGGRNTSLDRIDVDKNYCKENCRWTTMEEQQNNRSNNTVYKGKTLAQWCKELNLSHGTVMYRLRQGKSIEEALRL